MAHRNKSNVIDRVEATSDTLTSMGGLTFFARYLRNIAIYPVLVRLFGSIRKNAKGQPVSEIFKQVFCFLLDVTNRHLVYFDALKKDEGYAAAIETARCSLPMPSKDFLAPSPGSASGCSALW